MPNLLKQIAGFVFLASLLVIQHVYGFAPISLNTIQKRPTGTPVIDTSNSLASGLVYYTFDTGSGYAILADSSPGHLMYPPTLYGCSPLVGGCSATNPTGTPSIVTNNFGTAYSWPGATADSSTDVGMTSYVFDTDTLRDIVNLYNQGTGAGLTIAVWYVQYAVNPVVPLLFGRSAKGFTESEPYATFLLSNDNGQKARFWFYTDGASAASVLESPTDYALGVMHVAFGTCKNDSAGSATCILTVDGAEVASSSGNAVRDTTPGQENNEGQVQVGSSWHLYANHVFNVCQCQVFAGSFWSRSLTLSERQQLTASPWRMFR